MSAALCAAAALETPKAVGQPDRVGVYSSGQWILDVDGDGLFGAGSDFAFFLGFPGAEIVVGDWNGDGRESPGVFANGFWFLDYNGDGQWDGGVADKMYPFGWAGTSPVVGDWNGDDATDVGVFYQGSWFLDFNGNELWDGTPTDRAFSFGWPGTEPHVGDWNGDGKSSVGFFSGSSWFLDYDGNQVWDGGAADRSVALGWSGSTRLVGDWDGDGRDQVGVFSAGFWFLDYDGDGLWDGGVTDQMFPFGWNGVEPVLGDWNGDGKTQVGAFYEGNWFLDQNGNALWDGGSGDAIIGFGGAGNTPVPGRWGPPAGGAGLVDPPNGQTGVPTNRRIIVSLPAAVDPGTVTSSTVQLERGSTVVPTTLVLSTDNRFLSIRPDAPLSPLAQHTLTITGLKAPVGADVVASLVSSFQTGSSADNAQLFVYAGTLFPLPLNASLYFELTPSIDPTTFNPSGWFVREVASGTLMPLDCALADAWDSVSCELTEPLWAGANHELVGPGIETLTGQPRSSPNAGFFPFTAGFEADNTAPTLLGVSPPDGHTGFPFTEVIRLIFSERVNVIGPGTKIAVECGGAPIPALVKQSPPEQGPQLILDPPQDLTPGASCQVVLENVRDMAGLTFPGPFTSSFTTNGSGGVFSSVHYFPDGSADLPLNPTFRATFSSPVVDATVSAETMKLSGPSGPVAASIAVTAPNQVTLIPTAPLVPFSSYRLEIGPGLLNADGFSHFHVMDYMTGGSVDNTPPSVAVLSPPDGAVGVPPNGIVHVELSEPIDPGSVTPQSARITPTNLPLELIGNNVLRLPTGVALAGNGIDLNGLRDLAGNVMPRFTSGFQMTAATDTQGPVLQSSIPSAGATGVPTSQVIALQFDEGISAQSVDSTSVQLFVLQNGVFTNTPAETTVIGNVVEIRGIPNLLPNSEYKVDVGRVQNGAPFGPADYAGNRTPAFEAFTFTTGAGPMDTTPPQVTSITPVDGAVRSEVLNSNTRVDVAIRFSKAINPATLTTGSLLFLSNGLPGGVSFIEVDEDFQGVHFQVTGPGGMEAGVMTVIASSEIKDIAGNPLAADFFSQFTVQDAGDQTATFAIHETRPVDHAAGIPAASKISLLTNLPFFPGNLDQAFYVTANGQPVSGLFESRAGDRIVQFNPAQQLPAGATVQITPKLEFSAAGNRAPVLNALFPVSFQVEPDPAANPPELVGVSPNVPRDITRTPMGNTTNSRILARFSEPINPATVNGSTVQLIGPEPSTQSIAGTPIVTTEGDMIEFLPAQPLANGGRYELSISQGIQDLHGQPLGQGVQYSFGVFDTADNTPPSILAVSPIDGLQGASLNSLVKVRLTEAVNPLTLRDSTMRVLRNGAPILGVFKISANLEFITFTPLEYLAANTAYTVQLNGLEDAAGNPVAAKTWTFTTGVTADTIRPERMSALPQGNDVGVNAAVILRFNEAMDPTGIPTDFLKDAVFQPVPGQVSLSVDGKVIQFTPDSPLQPNTTYTAGFGDSDLAGNSGQNGQHSFTTGSGADLTRPTVLSFDPSDGTSNVSPFATISIEMSELVDPLTVNPQNVEVLDGLIPVPVLAQTHFDFRTIKIQALAALPLGRNLTVRVANIADVSGNTMAAPHLFSFSTRAALDFTGPFYWSNAKGSLGLPRDTSITLAFTEPLDPASVTPSTVYFAANLNPLPSVPTLDPTGRFIQLAPSGLLPENGWFQVIVDGATDVNGNPAQAGTPTEDYFGTGTDVTDAAPPAILQFQPHDGATNVPVNVIVDAQVSEPLDPFSYTGDFLEVRDPNGALVLARRPLEYHPPLAPNTTYTIHTKATADYAGKPLAAQTATFTTSANIQDNTAPQILSQVPTAESSGVPVDVVIVVDFSEPVVASNILLRFTNPFRDIPTSWTLTNGGQRLTIQPLEILAPSSYHSVYMTIFDLAGNGLKNPQGYYAFGFTTAAASSLSEESAPLQVLHVNPPAGATDTTGGGVTLTLSEPLDPATLGSVFLSVDGERIGLAGASLTGDGRTVLLSIPADLSAEEALVSVSDEAKAISGSRAVPFQSRLRYVSAGEASPARLVSVHPPAGSAGVAPESDIYLGFSGELDPSSVSASVEALSNGAFVSGSLEFSDQDRTLIFRPDLPFEEGAVIQVRVKQEMLRSADGTQLADWTHESFFRIGTGAVTPRASRAVGEQAEPVPEAIIWPADGEASVSRHANVTAVFAEPIEPERLALWRLGDDAPVSCRIALASFQQGVTVILSPHQPLKAGASYAVALGGSNSDSGKSILATFSTEPLPAVR